MTLRDWTGLEIAIVGMAGRFPGAADLDAFWRNLDGGVEAIRRLSPEELLAAGRPAAELADPAFVPAHGVLDGHDLFDADFFGYRKAEAECIDPQQRVFLELAWQALENAAVDPRRYPGAISVFAGSSADHYLHEQVLRNPAALERSGPFVAQYSNQPDHLATRVAYKLDLKGAAVAVQSACSTSLVAVHLACTHLLAGSCDLALAGGVSLTLPRFWGHRHEEGMILSPDGHCRAFDQQAAGTLKGDGAGIVVLKRLADALADGDRIEAVILASAINNDGAGKVGYTAPGLDGQASLIETVHAAAAVTPDSIGYVECHGTATPLGDPIEVAALTRAFSRGSARRGSCGLGSVKTGIGHLDAAAGVAGLIKAALALRHARLPASLNFSSPNPQLMLSESPFFVVDHSQDWPAGAEPRRAGVSSFGIGGTNAHVLLEEAPPVAPADPVAGPQLLLLSARSAPALAAMAQRLAEHLQAHSGQSLHDVAQTLARGRQPLSERRAVVARDRASAVAALGGPMAALAGRAADSPPPVVFMFPGQGAQYAGMARGLYETVAVFRDELDASCRALQPLLGLDLREILFGGGQAAADQLQQTAITQPALFAVGYSISAWLIDLGIRPAAVIGHSVGEIVAACVAGVFTRDEALQLVAARGRVMQAQPQGAMLAVALDAAELRPLLGPQLSLAADNAPGQSVASGPQQAVDELATRLAARGVDCTPLRTSHAFHSVMMDGAIAPYREVLAGLRPRPPQLRLASTVSGGWADATRLADPDHWVGNIRREVLFRPAAQALFELGNPVLLEVGPGTTLCGLVRRLPGRPAGLLAASTLRHPGDDGADLDHALALLGRLWCAGVEIGERWLGGAAWRRLALPGYPFQRQRHWVDPVSPAAAPEPPAGLRAYHPRWVRRPLRQHPWPTLGWALVGASRDLETCRTLLDERGIQACMVPADDAVSWASAWSRLCADGAPQRLLVLAPPGPAQALEAVPALLQALAADPPPTPLHLSLASQGAFVVLGDEAAEPNQALAWGWLQVLPTEVPGLGSSGIDLPPPGAEPERTAGLRAALAEAVAADRGAWLAWRRGQLWQRSLLPALANAEPRAALPRRLRRGGVYAISGGLGGMGLVLAEYLARTVQARLLLFGRGVVPARESWAGLANTDPAWSSVQRLRAIEAAGGTLMLAQADVGDSRALQALRQQVTERWGALHGLIHAAGVPGGGAIALQRQDGLDAVLAPKVRGTDVLLATLGAQALDFVLLCSSLTSFVALRGRSDYTAANLYLDAVAQARTAAGGALTLALNWDNWREIGMARSAAGEAGIIGLSNAEALAAFARALDEDEPQWVLAARDLLTPPAAAQPASPSSPQARPDDPPAAAAAAPPAAGSGAEQQLLDILRDLLDAPQMGPQDDFFSFGGDSVVSIQLVARARRAGLALGPRQVFELRSAAAMAEAIRLAGTAAPSADAGATSSTPPVAPVSTPIQRWFFSQPLPQRGAWSLVLELGLPVAAGADALFDCARALAAEQDVLDQRFDADGQLLPASGSRVDFEVVDLGELTDAAFAAALPALQERAGRAFDLARGPLLRLLHVGRAQGDGRLFIAAHHLVSDLIGLRAFADGLADAWQCRADGRSPPPVEPFSWNRWSARLHARAQAPEVKATLTYWTQMVRPSALSLPRDSTSAANLERGADSHRMSWPLPAGAAGADLAARLLAALGQALLRWSGQTSLWIDVEGHGRDDAETGIAHALGWFTTLYPVQLSAHGDPDQAAAAAAAALREAPFGGAGFGWLRWLHDEPAVRAEMAALPRSEVVFLYQGRRGTAAHPLLPTLGLCAMHDPANPRSHVFEINAWVEDGSIQLEWGFNRELHAPATVERLLMAVADEWQRHEQPQAAAPAAVVAAPLSLAQERLWFLEALQPDTTLFNKQAVIELDGPLDPAVLQAALGDLTARHAALRTRFALRDGEPVQCIDAWTRPPLPVVPVDDPAAAERLARERAHTRFDLATQPPFEARLLRFAPERHWLLLTIHHIVADAWSFQVLQRELAQFHTARRHGQAARLAPLPLSLADHARRQRERLSGPALQALLDYWKPRLAGLSPLELPTDRPRPPVLNFEGARVAVRWPAALTASFCRFAREQGASTFMGLLALYKLLLWRYTGQSDIVVGCTAADRPEVDTEGLVGPLVNNLVLRTTVDGGLDFAALLGRVRETAIGAFEQRDLPFEKLVEALNPVRDRSRAPLFQAMFAFMNVPAVQPAWEGLQARARELEAGGSEFDLSLYAYDPGSGPGACLSGWFEYATALFDAATIERLAGHLQQLAESVCAEPARRLALLPMLTPAERETILVDWNRTERAIPPLSGLHRLFELQAERTPDAPAVVCEDVTLSYAELDRRSNRLARLLRSRGVVAESRVVLCTDRSSALMVGLLGILKSGGAYVPVDPTYPPERIAGMVEDCGATVVLTQQRWLHSLPAGDTICLDRDAAALEGLDDGPLPAASGPGNLAYLIYTSGSTGRPKGVRLPHEAVLNFLHSMVQEPGLVAGDVLVAVTTLSFDIAVLELFGPLAVGAQVVLASREQALDGHALRGLLESSRATMMQATPSSWRMLVDAGWRGSPGFKALIGGEALPPDLAQQLLERCTSLWNLYGPTETTVWSSCWRVESPERGIRIGRPIANTQIYILDDAGEPCPIGVVGEIHIGGAGVALGYHDQPALTAQRFVPNTFSARPGALLYRTGDRGRWREDGQLEHLGRLDHQVKLRGHRVELGEIEVVVGRHPAVAQCVAVVREDEPGDQRLVAYAVPRGADRPGVAELRRWAGAHLPAFMLPAAVVWLEALPQTPNGKVNRAALPVPRSAAASVDDLPLNPAEQRIAEVFAEVLGGGPVRRYDNFFDLGGHSLLVMKVVDRLRRSAGIELHPGELFQQTVGQIAQHHAALLGVDRGTEASAAAARQRAADGVEAFFFAGTAGQLYGCLHGPPASPPPGAPVRAVLLCAPTGHEYTRCHRALKQLATLAAAAGLPVLRFDYHGSGDAEGDETAFSLLQARADIGSAVDELRRRSGAARVHLLGLRLGATLALQVACGRDDIGSAVLWEPVWDGVELLADWRAQHKAFMEALGYPDVGATQEVLGSPLPAGLADEITALGPAPLPAGQGPERLLAIGAVPPPGWVNGRGAPPIDRFDDQASPAIWRQEPLQAVVPLALLRRIVDWLGSGP